ncbi:MAG: NUDIX hydrolase [Candidatus Magasanikbacteria bacterium]|nr:NUDIX hydrolase [Candidatus Magasanikbacteria bacterium]
MIVIFVQLTIWVQIGFKGAAEMSATKKPSDVGSEFFAGRPADVNWTLYVDRPDGARDQFAGINWEATSRFGAVRNVVVCGVDGTPAFDRPEYREAPSVNVVAWGRTKDGAIKIGVMHEARPHADDPRNPRSREAVVVGQIPMGFKDKVVGKFESGPDAATREVREETGAAVVEVFQPNHPYHNACPTFVASWTDLLFVEVDLDRIENINPQHGELIYKAEYIEVSELLRRIRKGEHEGALYRAATTLSILMIFFATFPDFFDARGPKNPQ